MQYTASSSSSTTRTSHHIEEDDHDNSEDDEEGKDEDHRHGSSLEQQSTTTHQPQHVTQEMMRYDEDRSAARAMRLYTHRPPVIVTGQGRGGSAGRGRGMERIPSNARYTVNKPSSDASSSAPPLDDIHTPV